MEKLVNLLNDFVAEDGLQFTTTEFKQALAACFGVIVMLWGFCYLMQNFLTF